MGFFIFLLLASAPAYLSYKTSKFNTCPLCPPFVTAPELYLYSHLTLLSTHVLGGYQIMKISCQQRVKVIKISNFKGFQIRVNGLNFILYSNAEGLRLKLNAYYISWRLAPDRYMSNIVEMSIRVIYSTVNNAHLSRNLDTKLKVRISFP